MIGMSTQHNEEIRAIRQTVSFMRKRMALESSEAKRQQLKRDVNELENLIVKKLGETSDFHDIRVEEDVY